MTTSYPGVYMQEVSSGVRPIQAAGTSTAAFLGEAARGPDRRTGAGPACRSVAFSSWIR